MTATRPQGSPPLSPSAATSLLALADQCVQCGLCLPHCPTYQLDLSEAESPRGRITYIKALAAGTLTPTSAGDRHLDHCLGCRRCESACPAGVQYATLLVAARKQQRLRKPPTVSKRLTLWLMRHPRLLERLLAAYRRLAPRLPSTWRRLPSPGKALDTNAFRAPPPTGTAPAQQAPRAALFLGCIARAYEATTALALQRLLAAAGLQVELPTGQTCCGAAAKHAGDETHDLDARNRHAFANHATTLCLASGCQQRLTESLKGVTDVQDPLDVLASHLPHLSFKASNRRIAVHFPCSQRSKPALRRLLAAIPGLHVYELPDQGCCGAAGLHMLDFPDRAATLRAPLLADIRAHPVDEVLSTNIGCRLHIAQAASIPVRHPLDFLADHLS